MSRVMSESTRLKDISKENLLAVEKVYAADVVNVSVNAVSNVTNLYFIFSP